MKHKFLLISSSLVLLSLAIGAMIVSPATRWRLTPRPPVPPEAMHVLTTYERDHSSLDLGTQRITQFEAMLPAEALREFYRAELLKRGWAHTGDVRPECSPQRLPSDDMVDVYDVEAGGASSQRTLTLSMAPADATGTRRVIVSEYEKPVGFATQPTAAPGERVSSALIGDWTATDARVGRPLRMCFYENGQARLVSSDFMSSMGGEYHWVNDDAVRITLTSSMTFYSTNPRQAGDTEMCAELPKVLAHMCHTTISSPAEDAAAASYPVPAVVLPPTPTFDPTDPSTYPAPVAKELVVTRVEGVLGVTITGDTLTVSASDGASQSFQRIVR